MSLMSTSPNSLTGSPRNNTGGAMMRKVEELEKQLEFARSQLLESTAKSMKFEQLAAKQTDYIHLLESNTKRVERMFHQVESWLLKELAQYKKQEFGEKDAERIVTNVRTLVDKELASSSEYVEHIKNLGENVETLTAQNARLQQNIQAASKAHEREKGQMVHDHTAEVNRLEERVLGLNEVLHKTKSVEVVHRMKGFKKNLFEMKESLFCIRHELHTFHRFLAAEQPFKLLAHAFSIMSGNVESLKFERNQSCKAMNEMRQDLAVQWRKHPLVKPLAMNLGRRNDTAKILEGSTKLIAKLVETEEERTKWEGVAHEYEREEILRQRAIRERVSIKTQTDLIQVTEVVDEGGSGSSRVTRTLSGNVSPHGSSRSNSPAPSVTSTDSGFLNVSHTSRRTSRRQSSATLKEVATAIRNHQRGSSGSSNTARRGVSPSLSMSPHLAASADPRSARRPSLSPRSPFAQDFSPGRPSPKTPQQRTPSGERRHTAHPKDLASLLAAPISVPQAIRDVIPESAMTATHGADGEHRVANVALAAMTVKAGEVEEKTREIVLRVNSVGVQVDIEHELAARELEAKTTKSEDRNDDHAIDSNEDATPTVSTEERAEAVYKELQLQRERDAEARPDPSVMVRYCFGRWLFKWNKHRQTAMNDFLEKTCQVSLNSTTTPPHEIRSSSPRRPHSARAPPRKRNLGSSTTRKRTTIDTPSVAAATAVDVSKPPSTADVNKLLLKTAQRLSLANTPRLRHVASGFRPAPPRTPHREVARIQDTAADLLEEVKQVRMFKERATKPTGEEEDGKPNHFASNRAIVGMTTARPQSGKNRRVV